MSGKLVDLAAVRRERLLDELAGLALDAARDAPGAWAAEVAARAGIRDDNDNEDTMTADKTAALNIRVTNELLARVDALIPSLESDPDNAALGRITRASVARLALTRGLAVLEAESLSRGKGKKG